MIFLGIAIPIGILLGLLLFFSGLYSRNRLAAAASGGLDMFTTNFENQLDSVENYLLNLSLNDATFRSLSEQTDRTRAYLDAYEIAQGFPAVLAANDALMGVVLRSGSGNLYVGRYGAAAQQLKQKLNLEAYLGQPGQTNKMMTKGWYLRTIGQRLYLLRSVFYQKASLTAAVDLRLVFEELVEDYGLDGQVIVMNDSGNVLVGDANLLPTKMEWNSEGYCLTKVGRDSRLVVRKQVKALTVLYLVPYQHFGVDFAPYQILLVMGAVFVLLAIPFLLFYMKHEIFAPMTALVSTMDRIGRGELSVRSSVDYRNAEFTQVNETFNRMIDQITQLKIDGYEKELEARRNEMTALKLADPAPLCAQLPEKCLCHGADRQPRGCPAADPAAEPVSALYPLLYSDHNASAHRDRAVLQLRGTFQRGAERSRGGGMRDRPGTQRIALAAGLAADAGGEQRQARQDDRQNAEDHDHCKAPRNGRGLHGGSFGGGQWHRLYGRGSEAAELCSPAGGEWTARRAVQCGTAAAAALWGAGSHRLYQ